MFSNIAELKGMTTLRFLIHIANYIPWERGVGLSFSPSKGGGDSDWIGSTSGQIRPSGSALRVVSSWKGPT